MPNPSKSRSRRTESRQPAVSSLDTLGPSPLVSLAGQAEEEDEELASAMGYSRDLSAEQAFNFHIDSQAAIGYILSLTIGGTTIKPELGMVDPTRLGSGSTSSTQASAAAATVPAVGPLCSISWELGDTDPIVFDARVSPLAKQQIMMVQYAQKSVVDVEVAWATYEYDQMAHKYYLAFSNTSGTGGGAPAKGQLVKNGRSLDLKVEAALAREVNTPQNFGLQFSIVPKDNLTQTMYLATGETLRINKPWGRTKAAPA